MPANDETPTPPDATDARADLQLTAEQEAAVQGGLHRAKLSTKAERDPAKPNFGLRTN